jgi:hypothetical protein
MDFRLKHENRKSIALEVKFKDEDEDEGCGVDHFRICPHSCFSSNALVICTLFIDFPLIFHFPHLRGSGSLLRTNGQLVDPVNHPDVSLKR